MLTAGDQDQKNVSEKLRTLTDTDENDLRLALMELKFQFSAKSGSFFDPTSSHGFSEQLVLDIVKDACNIFSFEYLLDHFSMYSTQYVADVLEVFQELFEDISDFEQQMKVLGLLNSEVAKAERYMFMQAMELSPSAAENFTDSSDELTSVCELLEFELEF